MMGRAVGFLTVSYSADRSTRRCTNGRARRTPHDRAGARADPGTGSSISAITAKRIDVIGRRLDRRMYANDS